MHDALETAAKITGYVFGYLFFIGVLLFPVCLFLKLDTILMIYVVALIGSFFLLLCLRASSAMSEGRAPATGASLIIARLWGLLLTGAVIYAHFYTRFGALYYLQHAEPTPIGGGRLVVHPAGVLGVLLFGVAFLQVLPISRLFFWQSGDSVKTGFFCTACCVGFGALLFVV